MPTPRTHSKREVIFTNTLTRDDLNFHAVSGNLISDPIDINLSSALSLHLKNDSSVTLSLIDKEATDYIGSNIVLATTSGTDISIHKPLLRQGSFGKMVVQLTGLTTIPTNLKIFVRTTNEFGNASS